MNQIWSTFVKYKIKPALPLVHIEYDKNFTLQIVKSNAGS